MTYSVLVLQALLEQVSFWIKPYMCCYALNSDKLTSSEMHESLFSPTLKPNSLVLLLFLKENPAYLFRKQHFPHADKTTQNHFNFTNAIY